MIELSLAVGWVALLLTWGFISKVVAVLIMLPFIVGDLLVAVADRMKR